MVKRAWLNGNGASRAPDVVFRGDRMSDRLHFDITRLISPGTN